MKGFTANGKHSFKDFGFYMESKSIQPPSKKVVKDDCVGMNGMYDFSAVASGGEITYTERNITINLALPTRNKRMLYIKYTKLLEWLQDSLQVKIIFDDMSDYYFFGSVDTIPTFEEINRVGKLTIIFACESFKTSMDYVGNDIFDIFNFEEDVVQNLTYNVANSLTATIYNYGRLIIPTINCSAAMTITVDGVVYNLVVGDNTLYKLRFKNGYNTVVITGTGIAKVLLRKVVL